jgi:hypothetical protein
MTNAISNVTQLTDKKPQPQAKFTFTATLDGFPITIEGEGRAGDLKIIIMSRAPMSDDGRGMFSC